LTTLKPLTVWITTNCGKFWKRWEYQTTLPASCEICMQVKKQQLEPYMEQWTGSKLGRGYIKAVYGYPAHVNSMRSVCVLSSIWLCVILWTAAHPVPLSMGFPGQNPGNVMPCSRASSWPRDQTSTSHVSCIAGGFFHCWATREVPDYIIWNAGLDELQVEIKIAGRNINNLR